MTTENKGKGTSRRSFLTGAAAMGAGAVTATVAKGAGPDPLITEKQAWAMATGDGVDATPYGLPIRFESDVVRRNVEWLTADTISSINLRPFTRWMARSHRKAAPLNATILVPSNWPKKIIA